MRQIATILVAALLFIAFARAAPVTRYTYDEIGNQLTQKDALDRTTHYAYDDLGRRTGRQLPGGQSESK